MNLSDDFTMNLSDDKVERPVDVCCTYCVGGGRLGKIYSGTAGFRDCLMCAGTGKHPMPLTEIYGAKK
jgi:hypothetical protein